MLKFKLWCTSNYMTLSHMMAGKLKPTVMQQSVFGGLLLDISQVLKFIVIIGATTTSTRFGKLLGMESSRIFVFPSRSGLISS